MDNLKGAINKDNKNDNPYFADMAETEALANPSPKKKAKKSEDPGFDKLMRGFDAQAKRNSKSFAKAADKMAKEMDLKAKDDLKEFEESLKQDGINIDSDNESETKWADKVQLPRGYSDISLNSLNSFSSLPRSK